MFADVVQEKTMPHVQVLLVEDNPSDAFVVSSLLDDIGYVPYLVYHVTSQAAAVLMLARQSFDVCLLDLILPDSSGFSALIDIQNKAPEMPVLILTGVNDTELAKRAVARGAQDYLRKDELEMAVLSRAVDYAIERKRIEKTLFGRANHDALTGLVNRDMFESRLGAALLRSQRSISGTAILFIGLDHFKQINDLYGHDAGDDVLKTVARRLKEVVRAYDTSARFSGDEFAVLLEGIACTRDAATVAQKIITTMAVPIPCRDTCVILGTRIGIAFSDVPVPQEVMMQQADAARQQAKHDGGGVYRFYSEDMQGAAAASLQLEEDLRTALLSNEFQLSYQPYVMSGNATVLGVETLLRWVSPLRGMVLPQDFLPAAEAKRLMPQIGAWIGAQLHRDISLWNSAGIPPLEIAINLSPSQIEAPGLLDWIAPLAQEDFLGNHQLAVEIPEEALVGLVDARFATLAQLKDMGISLHLDHFGGGTLSLQTLLALPFSMLKLDLSVVQGMVDRMEGDMLISAAIVLAHHVGMKVGAVGVEIPWQQKVLAAHDCDVMQGFLTARPMTAEQIVGWLKQPQAIGA
jgi:diguanylate cyclase (GGDEF)-like protein